MKKYFIGIALIICCIVGYSYLYDKFLMPRSVLVSLSLMVYFLFAVFYRKDLRVPKSNVYYSCLIFVALNGLSIIWSVNVGESVFHFCQSLMGLMVCVVFFNFLTDEYQAAKRILWISAGVILIVYLLFSIIQLFHIHDTSFEQLYNVSGINAHKNLLSIMLFLLSAFLLTAVPEISNKPLKVILLTLFGSSILIVVLLKSRAVILGFVIAVAVFLILYYTHSKKFVFNKRRKVLVTFIAIALTFLFFTILLRQIASRSVPQTSEKSEIEYRITSTSSLAERFLLWDKTYRIVDKHPFLGCGGGNWQIVFPDANLKGLYRADIWNINFTHPHNEYLGILAESGYVGLLLYLAFICSLVFFSGCAIIETSAKKEFFFGAITLSIVCGCCINAFFDFPNNRIEHLVWMSIFYAILFRFISNKKQDVLRSKSNGKTWNLIFLILAVFLVMNATIRFKGEYETVKMQQALQHRDWKSVERFCSKAVSPFYTVDPVGMPLHWYLGQAQKATGQPQSVYHFRKAYENAPFCKENLNDLGVDEYYIAGNFEQAKSYLHEAIRISPNYIYPYFNLAYIYLVENKLLKAKEVTDMIYFDEHKREVMKADAIFFEPFNTELEKQNIDANYETVVELRHIIDSLLKSSIR